MTYIKKMRFFSNDAKKLADFYGEIFNHEITSSRENGITIYECRIDSNIKFIFINSTESNSHIGMEFNVGERFKIIETILSKWNLPYERQASDIHASLQTKDPDGNELLFKKGNYAFMPIIG